MQNMEAQGDCSQLGTAVPKYSWVVAPQHVLFILLVFQVRKAQIFRNISTLPTNHDLLAPSCVHHQTS